MTAAIIDGKAIAAPGPGRGGRAGTALTDSGAQPGLAAILVGDDPASAIYVGAKQKACAEVGIRSERVDLSGDVPEAELLAEIRRLNKDPRITGSSCSSPSRTTCPSSPCSRPSTRRRTSTGSTP